MADYLPTVISILVSLALLCISFCIISIDCVWSYIISSCEDDLWPSLCLSWSLWRLNSVLRSLTSCAIKLEPSSIELSYPFYLVEPILLTLVEALLIEAISGSLQGACSSVEATGTVLTTSTFYLLPLYTKSWLPDFELSLRSLTLLSLIIVSF